MGSGVTVALCCHNSVNELEGTLKHLAYQKVKESLKWEILLVNNASTDNTAAFAEKVWQELGSKVPLRIVEESVLGLSHARKTGFLMANYEYVLILDDDVLLAENYIQTGFDKMSTNNRIGVLCGWGEPKFGIDKLPDWLTPDFQFSCLSKPPCERKIRDCATILMGAFTRKSIWTKLYKVGFNTIQEGRKGNSLGGGEDLEMTCMVTLLGYEIWESPQLYFQHFIPAERLSKEHVKKMSIGNGKVKTYILPYYWLCNNKLGILRNNLVIQMVIAFFHSIKKPFATSYYDQMKKIEYKIHFLTIPEIFFSYPRIRLEILKVKRNYQDTSSK